METVHKKYRVKKSRIGFLKYIFEAYEGLAVVTTLDSQEGLVRLAISPGCVEEACAVMDDLKKDMIIHDA